MVKATVSKVGGSFLEIALSEATRGDIRVAVGDTVYLASAAEIDHQMAGAAEVMEFDFNLLRELAKR